MIWQRTYPRCPFQRWWKTSGDFAFLYWKRVCLFARFQALCSWDQPGVGKSQAVEELAQLISSHSGKIVHMNTEHLLMFNKKISSMMIIFDGYALWPEEQEAKGIPVIWLIKQPG